MPLEPFPSVLDEKPAAGFSVSKPDPANGSPPKDVRDPPGPLEGGSGCRFGPPFEPACPLELGGGVLPPPALPEAKELTPATALEAPLEPALPADAAEPTPARAGAPLAIAPTPAAAAEPTASAALPTAATNLTGTRTKRVQTRLIFRKSKPKLLWN